MRKKSSNNLRIIWTTIAVVCCLGFICCLIYIIFSITSDMRVQRETDQLKNASSIADTQDNSKIPSSIPSSESSAEQTSEEETTPPSEENQLDSLENYDIRDWAPDFETLWQKCEDIYAWLYVPGTDIDYPVVQHPTQADYYLRRDLSGKSATAGCIFTEYYNAKDWTDYNTVIYGHNMHNGTMFATLHNFEEKDFFDENRYVYIYTPDTLKIYEVFASYDYSNVHLLYAFDTDTEEGFSEYLDEIYDQADVKGALFREDVEVTPEDRIITLSTCIRSDSDKRFLVQAKLVAEGAWSNNEMEHTEFENDAEN